MAPAKINQIPLFLFRNYLQIKCKGAHTGYKSCRAKIRTNIFCIEQDFYLFPVYNYCNVLMGCTNTTSQSESGWVLVH